MYEKKENIYKIVFLIVINALLIFPYLIFTGLNSQQGDDLVIGFISQGAYGVGYSQYLIYPNVIWGFICKILGNIFPQINWNTILQILLSIASFLFVDYLIARKFSKIVAISLNILITATYAVFHFSLFQYTQNASLYLGVGMAGVMFYLFEEEKERKKFIIIIGGVLGICGFLLRLDSFLCMIPFFLVIIIYYLFCLKKGLNKLVDKKTFFTLLVLCLIAIAAFLCDKITYSTKEWKDFTTYNIARTQVIDYGVPEYEAYKDKYDEIGLSENDYTLLKRWVYADLDIFSEKTMEQIASFRDTNQSLRINREIIKSTMETILHAVKKYSVSWITIISFVFILVFSKPLERIIAMGIIGSLSCEYWYLICRGRINFRAEYGIWLFAFMSLLILISFGKKREWKIKQYKAVVVGVLFLSFVNIISNFQYLYQNTQTQIKSDYERLLERVSEEKNKLFVMSSVGGQGTAFDLYDVLEENIFSNMYFLGGWYVPSPIVQEKLSDYEITNPILDLCNNENVYLVDTNKLDLLICFLQEHYNVKASFSLLEEIGEYKIYKLYK